MSVCRSGEKSASRFTCPKISPPRVVVSGYRCQNTQCRDGRREIGHREGQILVQRGFIDAVDVWSYVPMAGMEVCFRNKRRMAGLPGRRPTLQRKVMEFASIPHREGMTCGHHRPCWNRGSACPNPGPRSSRRIRRMASRRQSTEVDAGDSSDGGTANVVSGDAARV